MEGEEVVEWGEVFLLQPAMEDILGPPSWVPTEVMQVVDISNRTGQDTMKNRKLAAEDTTLELMVLTGALMVMEEVKMSGVETGKLDIQKEGRGEIRVLDTRVGEATTARREMKAELEPWKNCEEFWQTYGM